MCVCTYSYIVFTEGKYINNVAVCLFMWEGNQRNSIVINVGPSAARRQFLSSLSIHTLWHTHIHSDIQAHTHMHIQTDKQTASGAKQRCNLLSENDFDFDLMLQAVVADIYF